MIKYTGDSQQMFTFANDNLGYSQPLDVVEFDDFGVYKDINEN